MAATPQRVLPGTGAQAISSTVLVVAEPFPGRDAELGPGRDAERSPGLDAERVAGALARGLEATERRLVTRRASPPVSVEELRAARAVVIAAARLDERTLAQSWAFETATSARQAGVPAYAVTAENALDRFDARMLDLQAVVEAGSPRALRAAGARLAAAI